MSKQAKYINFDNFLNKIDLEDFSLQNSRNAPMTDGIRFFSGNFWTIKNNELVVAATDKQLPFFKIIPHETKKDTYVLQANKSKFMSRSINKKGLLEDSFDFNDWEIFTNNLIFATPGDLEDHNFNFAYPINIEEYKERPEPNLSFINKEFIYNFDAKKFENLTRNKSVDITSLPSILSVINDQKLDNVTFEENVSLTLGGLIPISYAQSLFISKEFNDSVREYFNLFSDTYFSQGVDLVTSELATLNSSLTISKSSLNILRKIDFVPFPWYVNIRFTNLGSNHKNIFHHINSYPTIKNDFIEFIKENERYSSTGSFVEKLDNISAIQTKVTDFKQWIGDKINDSPMQNATIEQQEEEPAFLPSLGALFDIEDPDRTSIEPYKKIEYANLLEYIKNNIKPKIRKYENFLTSQSEHHVLMYKIEKRMFGYDRSVIQEFWIEPDEESFINFIDTQVKYGVEYYYTIKAYVLSVGNSYTYKRYDYSKDEAERLLDLKNGIYKINISNSASYKILELQIGNFFGSINEPPPTKPRVSFNVDGSSLRINLKESEESSLEEFNIVEYNELDILNSIRYSQNNIEEEKIYSKNTSDSKNILQIYRINNFPVNFLSFQGKLYKTLTLDKNSSFLDSIIPNIKYYYMFRYVNSHQVPSNTSIIYELELRDEEGYYYLISKEIDLNKHQEKTSFKEFKRYLLIRPSTIQTQLNTPNQINNARDVKLGPSGENVWRKDFLVRITSKKTNRVIEFNIKSKINHNNN